MSPSQQNVSAADKGPVQPYDAIIIGAGMAGMYQLYRLRKLGLSVWSSRVVPGSAAPGIGTAILERVSIPRVTATAIRSRKNCSKNGR